MKTAKEVRDAIVARLVDNASCIDLTDKANILAAIEARDAEWIALPACLKPMTEEQRAKFVPISDEAIAEALRKGAEARYRAMHPTIPAPATQEREPVCASWCGTVHIRGGTEARGCLYHNAYLDYSLCMCTPACRDAGRPLHPSTPTEEPR